MFPSSAERGTNGFRNTAKTNNTRRLFDLPDAPAEKVKRGEMRPETKDQAALQPSHTADSYSKRSRISFSVHTPRQVLANNLRLIV